MYKPRGGLGSVSYYDYTAVSPDGSSRVFRVPAESQTAADVYAAAKAASWGAELLNSGAPQKVTTAPTGTTAIAVTPSVAVVPSAEVSTGAPAEAARAGVFSGKLGLLLAAGLAFAFLRKR